VGSVASPASKAGGTLVVLGAAVDDGASIAVAGDVGAAAVERLAVVAESVVVVLVAEMAVVDTVLDAVVALGGVAVLAVQPTSSTATAATRGLPLILPVRARRAPRGRPSSRLPATCPPRAM